MRNGSSDRGFSVSSSIMLGALAVAACATTLAGLPELAEDTAEAPEFVESWILVRLERPLAARFESGDFSLVTGSAALDEALEEVSVRRITYALGRVVGRSPRPARLARYGFDRTYRFHLPEDADVESAVERFARVPGVTFAEPDYIATGGGTRTPNDPFYSAQYAYWQASDADMDGPEAWDRSVGGSNVVIAVVDSGADSDHEDLGNKLVAGVDFVNDDDDPEDDHSHGTNVASIAAAESDNSTGVVGACWNCRIMPIKVLNSSNFGSYADMAAGFVWATDHGADLINGSVGGVSPSSTLLNAVEYAYDAGVIHISITHNDNAHAIRYPGRYSQTIAIGATDENDERAVPFCYSPTSGSNWGPEIDVVAPGELIYGAVHTGGYSPWCGTSQAAPLVAGLVGIMMTENPSLGREEARHLLRAGAEDQVGRPTEDTPGFDEHHGWGRVNMDTTLATSMASIGLRLEEGPNGTRIYYEAAVPIALSYDFLRGDDLASLSEGVNGVALGPVTCIENNSSDPDTFGNEDAATPAPGTGFFYLGRFRAGAGNSSYGGSSRNRDRIASIGVGCSPF